LAAAGYGFVPPAGATSKTATGLSAARLGPMVIPVQGMYEKVAYFAAQLQRDEPLRAAFRNDPVDTLIAAGVMPRKERITISKGNALFFYLTYNTALQRTANDALLSYNGVRKALNPYTARRTAPMSGPDLMEISDAYFGAVDFPQSFEAQLSVLIGDPYVRHILGVSDDVAQRNAFVLNTSRRFAQWAEIRKTSRGRSAESGDVRDTASGLEPLGVYLNYMALFNITVTVDTTVYVNSNFSIGVVTTTQASFDVDGPGDSDISGNPLQSVQQRTSLKHFCDQLASAAPPSSNSSSRNL
jgi:hypothetical protein